MKYKSYDTYVLEEEEPSFHSCQECNPAHKYLHDPDSTLLFWCPWCDRGWICGEYLDNFKNKEEMDTFLKKRLEGADDNL